MIGQKRTKAGNARAERAPYDEQREPGLGREQLRVLQIVSPDEATAPAVKRQAEAGADFGALALQRSTDSATRPEGGDLGWRATDSLPEGFAPVLTGAKAGAVVGPVKVEGGYATLKLQQRRPERISTFEDAKRRIIRYDAIRAFLARLRRQDRVDLLIAPGPQPAEPASAPKAVPTTLRGPR